MNGPMPGMNGQMDASFLQEPPEEKPGELRVPDYNELRSTVDSNAPPPKDMILPQEPARPPLEQCHTGLQYMQDNGVIPNPHRSKFPSPLLSDQQVAGTVGGNPDYMTEYDTTVPQTQLPMMQQDPRYPPQQHVQQYPQQYPQQLMHQEPSKNGILDSLLSSADRTTIFVLVAVAAIVLCGPMQEKISEFVPLILQGEGKRFLVNAVLIGVVFIIVTKLYSRL